MPQIIVDPQKDTRTVGTPFVTEETDHLYTQPRPINPLFERILFAVVNSSEPLQRRRLELNFGMSKERARVSHDIGVFTGTFDGWTCTVNWTPNQHGKLPPGHAVVSYGGMEMGIISPFMDGKPVFDVPSRNEWFGLLVKPHDLSRACAATVARGTDKDYMWEAFGGPEAEGG